MTAVVGILCSDGAVVGTDSSMTSVAAGGFRTIEQPTEKLDILKDRIIIAGTGSVGHGQRFKAVVEDCWQNKMFSGTTNIPIDVCVNLSAATLSNFVKTNTSRGAYNALVAFSLGTDPVLCEFDDTFQPHLKTEQEWFCSMGSTQPITDPFLALMREIFWSKGQPTVQEATPVVTWTLDHAIALNTGGVNGPARIAVLAHRQRNNLEARLLKDSDLDEHRSWIQDAKSLLSEALHVEGGPDVPRSS